MDQHVNDEIVNQWLNIKSSIENYRISSDVLKRELLNLEVLFEIILLELMVESSVLTNLYRIASGTFKINILSEYLFDIFK